MSKLKFSNQQKQTMDELSEEYIRKHCPHCDPNAEAYKYLLDKTDNFSIVCDPHPITEGHILIIPKQHLSCIGEYPENLYKEFLVLYKRASDFLSKEYASVSSFEHGKFGQTVFHSHVHLIPFKGNPTDIVPEGSDKLILLNDLSQIRDIFKENGGYLFLSIGDNKWSIDVSIAVPRFFRDRFAKALNRPGRGNWKEMHVKENGYSEPESDAKRTKERWVKSSIHKL